MTNEVAAFLSESSGDRYPSMKFQNLKDFVSGTIVDAPRVVELDSKFRKGEIDRFLVINVEVLKARGAVNMTDEDGAKELAAVSPGVTVSVWVKSGFMAQAVAEAVREAGAKSVDEGGTFSIALIEERDTGKGNPAKIYRAKYEPPARGVSMDEWDDTGIPTSADDESDIPF